MYVCLQKCACNLCVLFVCATMLMSMVVETKGVKSWMCYFWKR